MSISNGQRQYHHGDLKALLVEKTVDMLRTHSLEALSLRKIAREAGVSHNAPYMHFRDKEALISAVSDHGFAALTRAMQSARADTEDWHGAVQATGQAYVRFLLDHAPLAEVMFRPRPPVAVAEAAGNDSGNSGAIDSPGPSAAGLAMFGCFADLSAEGEAAGILAPSSDPRQAALHLWTALHGAAMVIRATRSDPVDARGRDVDDQVARQLDVVLRGLAP